MSLVYKYVRTCHSKEAKQFGLAALGGLLLMLFSSRCPHGVGGREVSFFLRFGRSRGQKV